MSPAPRFDVVVIGGGAGGSAAAVGAARIGARVLLVERYGFLGGAATNAQVLSYCGFHAAGPTPRPVVGGVGRTVLDGLAGRGFPVEPVRSKSGNWIVMIDPEAVKITLDELVAAHRVSVMMHTRLVDAVREGKRLAAVTVADHAGLHDIAAGAFVDASGEADLAASAGIGMSQPGGPGAHVQPASLPVRIGGVAPDVVLDRARMTALVAAHNATADVPITRADGGVLARLPGSGDVWWMAIDIATDGLSGADLARAEMAGRAQAWANLAVLRRHPGFERAHLVATGPQIGIRETRRPRAVRDASGDDARRGARRADAIARAGWPMEVHEAPGRTRFVPLGGDGFFDVGLDALRVPDLDNLWLAGRVIGADAEAYGSVRVMGTAFATGQAAGVAAALQQDGRLTVEGVQAALRAQDALI